LFDPENSCEDQITSEEATQIANRVLQDI